MIVEDTEASNGWPLGLGNINMRLRAAQNSQAAAAAAAAAAPPEPYSSEMASPGFSSFSSSNLDTESTASFFQDHSVPLGRLIGIRPAGNRGNSHFPNTISRTLSPGRTHSQIHRAEEASQGLCVPLLHNVIEKMSRSKSSSKHSIEAKP